MTPEEYLDINADGNPTFDLEREVFSPLNCDAVDGQKIVTFQPVIRHEEHLASMGSITGEILRNAGYALQTFGIGEDYVRSESGVALKIRERPSLMTRERKSRIFIPVVADILERMLIIDAEQFTQGLIPERPTVELGDSYAPDITETANVLELLNRAQALTYEEVARTLFPDRPEEDVQAYAKSLEERYSTNLDESMDNINNAVTEQSRL